MKLNWLLLWEESLKVWIRPTLKAQWRLLMVVFSVLDELPCIWLIVSRLRCRHRYDRAQCPGGGEEERLAMVNRQRLRYFPAHQVSSGIASHDSASNCIKSNFIPKSQ